VHARSPAAARRELGDELRNLRTIADLTLRDVAKAVQRSVPTISRLERGEVSLPRVVEVDALLRVYRREKPDLVSNEKRRRIHNLVEECRSRDHWLDSFSNVLSSGPAATPVFRRLVELESDASEILNFQQQYVPGLLQTPDYARSVADLVFPHATAEERIRFVEFRLARQDHMGDRPFHMLIKESALRPRVGSRTVMAAQMRSLLVEIQNGRPNVEIGIIPDDLAIRAATAGPFVLLRMPDQDDVVHLEGGRAGGEFSSKPEDIAAIESDFKDLVERSLGRDQTVSLLHRMIGE
jgi:transcriptional regulator with XRE-family HTH domain